MSGEKRSLPTRISCRAERRCHTHPQERFLRNPKVILGNKKDPACLPGRENLRNDEILIPRGEILSCSPAQDLSLCRALPQKHVLTRPHQLSCP
ncbi:hypothetical protein EVA_05737 [gut metagenome]|uniref:Uncharacterized protein n=1 Tax=gut metagenome TaxID=749906 RepID=J9GGP6_9ZZZZ